MASNGTSSAWKLSSFVIPIFVVEGVIIWMSNLLVILPIIQQKALQRTKYLPILSLAIADITNGFIFILVVLIVRFKGGSDFIYGLNVFGHAASVVNIVVVCCDRWVAIFRPLRYRDLLPRNRMLLLIGSSWITSVLVAAPIAFTDIHGSLATLNSVPKSEKIYITTLLSMLILVWLLLGFMQFRVIRTVRHHLRRIAPVSMVTVTTASSSSGTSPLPSPPLSLGKQRSHFKQREFASAIAVNLIYLFIIVTWSPFMFIILFHLCGVCPKSCVYAMQFAVVVLEMNCFVNPIIYGLRMQVFRTAVRNTLCSVKCCKK